MGLRPLFTRADVRRAVEARKTAFRQAVLNRLEMVGWEFVRNARSKSFSEGGFRDVTGNLRSSIFFVVVDHGRAVKENFETSRNGSDKLTGVRKAKELARSLISNYTEGYALIVGAGMEYAAAVESRGKDVITGSSLEAEEMLKRAIDRLKARI